MALQGKRIVIAEEDASSAKVAAVLLEGAGCTVWLATSAEEALALAQLHRAHAVILEVVLSVMGGIELARRIRAEDTDPPVVLIALTTFNGPAAASAALAAGIDEYVRKPIDPDTFVALVERLLGGRA